MSSPAPKYVIIQAGGKGTRLEQYTWNKPKCLAPVSGKPLLYHFFEIFPEAHFLIIIDYKKQVVENFLKAFPPSVSYTLIAASGTAGNVAGLREAAGLLPDDAPVVVTWCDLMLYEPPPMMGPSETVTVLTTDAFPCRWLMRPDGSLIEQRSETDGIAGLFGFPKASMLKAVPDHGEFVAWLATSKLPLQRVRFSALREIGTIDALVGQWTEGGHSRFFNSVEILPDRVIKRARIPEFQALLDSELRWYRYVAALGFTNIPNVISEDPLTIERIHGRHPFDFAENQRGKEKILANIIQKLSFLHSLQRKEADHDATFDVYYTKTLKRLEAIQRLVPEIASTSSFRINGLLCRNILHADHSGYFATVVRQIVPSHFSLIHGDPTFSNTIIDGEMKPYFIDPRGTFGRSQILGDPSYDWAKLLYSVAGAYDNFNRRQFLLELSHEGGYVQIRPSAWGHLRGLIREHVGPGFRQVQIIHALIWLSLSGYVTDDYDSIVASFFLGLFFLEEAAV